MDNVVSLKDFRSKKRDSSAISPDEAVMSLIEIAKRNAENDKRVREERAMANKNIVKSLKKR